MRPNSLQVQSQSSHILIANANGGIFLLLVQKLVSKSNKNRIFCILCMPMGRPNPPPHMATLLLSAVRIGILPFNSSSIALVSFFIDLRKKKGKMPILAAKSRLCECSFRYILLKAVAIEEPAGTRPFLGQDPSWKCFSLLGNGQLVVLVKGSKLHHISAAFFY